MTTQTGSSPAGKPWYREPWPWILIALPGSVVLAGIVTILIAVYTNDGLVVDDYYKEGLAINRTLAKGVRAKALGLQGTVLVLHDHVAVTLSTAATNYSLPDQLQVRVTHPTRSGLDQVVELRREGAAYRATVRPLEAGRWYVRIEDPTHTWRLTAVVVTPMLDAASVTPEIDNKPTPAR